MAEFSNRLRPYASQFGFVAIVFLVLSFVARQLGSNPIWLPQAFLAIGVLLLLLYVIADWQAIVTALSGRQARYGGNALVLSLAVVGIVVILNYLFAFRYHQRFDLTANKAFSLTPQTIDVLNKLQTPIQVVGFFPQQGGGRQQGDDLLKEYLSRTDKIQYKVVDPDVDPVTARSYGTPPINGFIVQQGDKKQEAISIQESDLTNAIVKVISGQTKTIYFVTGHRERSATDTNNTGFSQWTNILTSNNYKLATINLATLGSSSATTNTTSLSQTITLSGTTSTTTTTVPSDATLVILAGPQAALSDPEKQNLALYLAHGGSLFVMADAQLPDPIGDLLVSYGLSLNNDIVVDQVQAYRSPLVPATATYGRSPITDKLQGGSSFFPGARSINVASNQVATLTLTSLVQSSQQSFGHKDFSFTQTGQLSRAANDTPGPLTIFATSQTTDGNTRVALAGNSEFLSNATLAEQVQNVNIDLGLNTVNWLAKNETAPVAIQPKTPDNRPINPLTSGQSILVLLGTVVLFPLLTVISGILVWLRRR